MNQYMRYNTQFTLVLLANTPTKDDIYFNILETHKVVVIMQYNGTPYKSQEVLHANKLQIAIMALQSSRTAIHFPAEIKRVFCP